VEKSLDTPQIYCLHKSRGCLFHHLLLTPVSIYLGLKELHMDRIGCVDIACSFFKIKFKHPCLVYPFYIFKLQIDKDSCGEDVNFVKQVCSL